MKVYIITEMQSNICEVTNTAYINRDKAFEHWERLYKEAKEEIKYLDEPEEQEFILSDNHKSLSYDDGMYFNLIIFDTQETAENEK